MKDLEQFYFDLGVSPMDIIERGKIPPWNLHVFQIERGMKIVRDEIEQEMVEGVKNHGLVPRRVYKIAKNIKAKHFKLASQTIRELRKENEELRAQRGVIVFFAITIIEALCLRIWMW